jgi:predicted thioesterase
MARPTPGETAEIEVVVTSEMTARLFDREIHPVYGTPWMVRHVEESGRLIVERHLEGGEDAIGYSIELTHERPALVGDRLVVHALVVHADRQECVTEHAIRQDNGRIVGRGRFVQRYVHETFLEDR